MDYFFICYVYKIATVEGKGAVDLNRSVTSNEHSYFQRNQRRREERGRVACDEFGSARFARATHPRHSLFLGRDPTNAAATSNLGEIVPGETSQRKCHEIYSSFMHSFEDREKKYFRIFCSISRMINLFPS